MNDHTAWILRTIDANLATAVDRRCAAGHNSAEGLELTRLIAFLTEHRLRVLSRSR